jgi:hypothetical protein
MGAVVHGFNSGQSAFCLFISSPHWTKEINECAFFNVFSHSGYQDRKSKRQYANSKGGLFF